MAVKNLRRDRANVWIPTSSPVVAKIIIKKDDGTLRTVMDTYTGLDASNYTINASVTKAVTDKLGSFNLRLINDDGRFLNDYNGGESVYFFADTNDATIHIFHGTVDSVKYGLDTSNGFFVELHGREYPELIDKSITGIIVAERADLALSKVLYNDYPDINLQYWDGTQWLNSTFNPEGSGSVTWSDTTTGFPETLINTSYQHQKGWNTITEICRLSGLDCYLEYSYLSSIWYLRVFVPESVTNENVGIAYGINLTNLSEYGGDDADIYNRVIVYGKQESDNILVVKTRNDETSQSNLWIKDRIFNESALDSMEEVAGKAEYEITNGVNLSSGGRMTSLMVPNIRPGEKMPISVPYCNINGYYKIHNYTHIFDSEFTTTVEVSKKSGRVVDLFITKVNPQEFVSSISNPNGMTDSYTVYFNESPSKMTHINTEEFEERLRLQAGFTTGTATSEILNEDYDITECELRRYVGNDYSADTYEVSNQGGAAGTWEAYTELNAGQVHTFAVPGTRLCFRINMSRTGVSVPSPLYESVALLYR
jgi:hypothetical protein